MIIPISWSSPASIPNIDDLKSKIETRGGRVVEYRMIFSIVLLTMNHPRFVWIPEGGSRSMVGLRWALLCAVTGWWSIMGLFITPVIILNNLLGGVDVTKVLFPDSPSGGIAPEVIAELVKARKRQQYVFVGYLLLILAACFWFCIVPYVSPFKEWFTHPR